jgi:hypothetical protein
MANETIYRNAKEAEAFLADAVVVYNRSHAYKVWRKPDNTLWLEYDYPLHPTPRDAYWFGAYESYATRKKKDRNHWPDAHYLLNKTENKVYTNIDEVLIAAQKILGGRIQQFPQSRPRPPEFQTKEKYLVMDSWKLFGNVYKNYKMDPDEAASVAGLTFIWPKDYGRRYRGDDEFRYIEYEEAKAFLADAVVVYTSSPYKVWRKLNKSLWLEWESPDNPERYSLHPYNKVTQDDVWPFAVDLRNKVVN